MSRKIIEALLHTLLESYGNENIYHPDGVTTFSVSELSKNYSRWKEPEGKALEFAQYESTLDTVASELISLLDCQKVKNAYYAFSEKLQRAALDKYPTTKFQFMTADTRVKEYRLRSSHGFVYFNSETGDVTKIVGCGDEPVDPEIATIYKVDIEQALQNPHTDFEFGEEDILYVGYYYRMENGESAYEEPLEYELPDDQ